MSQTPFTDLGSQDILSAHLSGVQHAIGNIESVLNMKTAVVTGAPLTPVTDQVDASLRYLIYEGAIRNWLGSPTPVIKRGGVVVDPSEYTLYPAYGAIVFAVQQNSSSVITADVTYITNGSNVIDTVNANAASIAALNALSLLAKHYVGQYRSTGISIAGSVSNVGATANIMELYPFRVYETITVDNMGIYCQTSGVSALTSLGLYSDNNGYPGTLLAQTAGLDCSTTGWKTGPFSSGDKVLQPGLYWIARWCSVTSNYQGVSPQSMQPLPNAAYDTSNVSNATGLGAGGAGAGCIRYTLTYATTSGIYPTTFPALSGTNPQYVDRTTYAPPWVRRKS